MKRMGMLSSGVYVTVVLALGGIWLLLAPRVLNFQPPGQAFNVATRNDMIVGIVLVGSSVIGIILQVGLGLRDMVLSVRSQNSEQEPGA